MSTAAKIYNALLLNCIKPEIEKILRKNQNGFRRNRSTISQILTIRRILEGVRAKDLEAKLFVDFSKAFDFIHGRKMEQIHVASGLPKETIAAIMMLYKNTKVRSLNGDTDFFNIVAGVLQGDTLTPYLFILCQDNVLRTVTYLMKENGFTLEKVRRRRYPAKLLRAQTTLMTAVLANIPAHAESLLHSLERAAGGIDLNVKTDKMEYIYFNQRGDIYETRGQVHLPQK